MSFGLPFLGLPPQRQGRKQLACCHRKSEGENSLSLKAQVHDARSLYLRILTRVTQIQVFLLNIDKADSPFLSAAPPNASSSSFLFGLKNKQQSYVPSNPPPNPRLAWASVLSYVQWRTRRNRQERRNAENQKSCQGQPHHSSIGGSIKTRQWLQCQVSHHGKSESVGSNRGLIVRV